MTLHKMSCPEETPQCLLLQLQYAAGRIRRSLRHHVPQAKSLRDGGSLLLCLDQISATLCLQIHCCYADSGGVTSS